MGQAISARDFNSRGVSAYRIKSQSAQRLDAPTEARLVAEMRRGSVAARNALVEANLRLVVYVARQYPNRKLDLDDLIQEGNLGLLRALEKFDAARGARVSTHAVWWIRSAIQRALQQADNPRRPVWISERLGGYRQTRNRLTQELGHAPTPQELARAMNLTLAQIRLLENLRAALSLEAEIDDGEDPVTLGDFVLSSEPTPAEAHARDEERAAVRGALGKLKPPEREIVVRRCGLNGDEPQTHDQIAHALGRTRQAIQQREKFILQKLRRAETWL